MLCFYTQLYLSQVFSEDITQVRGTYQRERGMRAESVRVTGTCDKMTKTL